MIKFMDCLPTRLGSKLKIKVHEIPRPLIETGRCRMWMELVHKPFIENDPSRADNDWDWQYFIPLLMFGSLVRRPRLFQLCSANTDFPLAMVGLLENERWIHNKRQSSVFVWYVTGAPSKAVIHLGSPKLLTRAALDIATTVGLNGPSKGRLWLHASPEGGDALLNWYQSRGLKPVVASAKIPGPAVIGRKNDGRYFQLTPTSAQVVSQSMDEYRI